VPPERWYVPPVTARSGIAALTIAALGLLSPAPAAAAPALPAQRLAEAYAPIMMLREEQDPPCETTAEQYQPTSVNAVLGNPTVTLTHEVPGKGLEDLERAPTAADIAGLPDGYYLDLEGKVLGDTCVYARAFEKLKDEGKAPAVAYAHIAREAGHPGFVLQYWFYWYFNQFNDLHESDWEGMQLSFDAATPRAALAEEPSEIILFQHAGGERARWSDSKVKKEGTHPIVYPAAGSHATFYDSAVYIENGQHGSGVGCDNTSEPLRELRVRPVLLPEHPSERGRFRWLSYEGRWGEREKGFNNGPTGPATKTVWKEPFAWMADQRTTSPRLPGGSIAGPQITGAFCGAVASVSDFINLEGRSRILAIATLVGLLVLLVLFIGATRWGPIDLERLRARRTFGQLLRSARQLYGRHWTVVVPVALAGLAIVAGTNRLAEALGTSGGSSRTGVNLALGDLIESLGRPVATAIVSAVVIVFVRQLERGEPVGFAGAWRGMGRRLWRVVGAQLAATLAIIVLAATVIGIPIAAYKLVGWAFVQQEVLYTDRSIRDSFRGSSDLVRGRWWHAMRAVLFLFALSVVAGPVLTLALVFTKLPLLAINLLGALIFALMIPYVAIGETLLYLDLQVRAESEPAKPRRSWRPWLPRRFGRVVEPASRPLPSR
jgi:hypothetical protein